MAERKLPIETAIALARFAREVQDEMRARRTEHQYLSTGCLHGEHDYCASMTGLAGAKRPAQCKFCAATCICECHKEDGTSGSAVEGRTLGA